MVKVTVAFVISAVLFGAAACLPQRQADATASQDDAPYPQLQMNSGDAASTKAAAELVDLNEPFAPFPVGLDYILDMSQLFAQQLEPIGVCSKTVPHGCVEGKSCQLGNDQACVELSAMTKSITTQVFLGSMFKAGEVLSTTGKCSRGSQHCLTSGFCQIKASAAGKTDPDCINMSKEEKTALLQDLIMQVYSHDWHAEGQANYGFHSDDEVRSNMQVLMKDFGKCTQFDTSDCQRYNMCAVSETKGCIPFTTSEQELSEESAVQALRMARDVGVCKPGTSGCDEDGFCPLSASKGDNESCSVPHPARQYFVVQIIYSKLIGDLYGAPKTASVPSQISHNKESVGLDNTAESKQPANADNTVQSKEPVVTDTKQPVETDLVDAKRPSA